MFNSSCSPAYAMSVLHSSWQHTLSQYLVPHRSNTYWSKVKHTLVKGQIHTTIAAVASKYVPALHHTLAQYRMSLTFDQHTLAQYIAPCGSSAPHTA
eukprot:1344578-Rhodomonas_salina.1